MLFQMRWAIDRELFAVLRRAVFLVVITMIFAIMTLAVIARELIASPTGENGGPNHSPVTIAEVRDEQFVDVISVVGTAFANESVAVTSKVSEVVSRILFESGSFVKAGDVLIELANTEELAALEEAQSTLVEARRERDRTRELVADGLAPSQRRDEAESNYERAAARVSAIEARLADRMIRAPFDGIIGLRNISPGKLIQAGTAVAILNDVSVIKLDFEVPERFLAFVQRDQEVAAKSTAYPDETFRGVVTHIDNQVDRVSRTVTVRAEIPNHDKRLVPGMHLRAEVRSDRRTNPAIPESAAMRIDDHVYVFVVLQDDEGDFVQRRRITLGRRNNGLMEVTGGLEAGESVVADGTHRTRDGGRVRVSGSRSSGGTNGESVK